MPSEEVEISSGTASRRQRQNFLFFGFAAILFAAFALRLWYHAVRASVTVDESPHILAGYRHLQCGDYGINPEHPPMAKMLAATPYAEVRARLEIEKLGSN